MPTSPRISVIVPCRDEAMTLERTLCSVLDQGYGDVELLVADGGSTDGSVEIIERYADQIAWWRSHEDRGPADGVNAALQHATGQIVGILHAGDLYLPGTLEQVVDHMTRRDEACSWLAGHSLSIDAQDAQRGRLDAAMPLSAVSFLMHNTGQLPPSAVFYQRNLLKQHGGFDSRYRFAWDYEMHAGLILAGCYPTIYRQVLVAHRENAQPDRMQRILRQGMETIEVAERLGEQLPFKLQCVLWRNCDERRRIYALAEAEVETSQARRRLWQRLLHRPWWLASGSYRRTLLHDTPSAGLQQDTREAA